MIIGLSRFGRNFSSTRNPNLPNLPSFKINPQAIKTPSKQEIQQLPYDQYKQSFNIKSCPQQNLPKCRYFAVEYKNKIHHVFNAYYYPMGRMITKISTLIRGKASPLYKNSIANPKFGDKCIIVNASDPLLTGKKLLFKNLKYHTGFVGHLRTHSYKSILNKKPQLLYFYFLRKAMPKNKLSEKYLQNLKIFRGPVHNIANLPQFAPNQQIIKPLANLDIFEKIKNSNQKLELISTNSTIEKAKKIFGQQNIIIRQSKDQTINDTLQTNDKLGREEMKKTRNVIRGSNREKLMRKRQRIIDRYNPIRAPYKKKDKYDPGFQYFDSEKKAKKSPYYDQLADQDMQQVDEFKQDDPLKRKGFDKD